MITRLLGSYEIHQDVLMCQSFPGFANINGARNSHYYPCFRGGQKAAYCSARINHEEEPTKHRPHIALGPPFGNPGVEIPIEILKQDPVYLRQIAISRLCLPWAVQAERPILK